MKENLYCTLTLGIASPGIELLGGTRVMSGTFSEVFLAPIQDDPRHIYLPSAQRGQYLGNKSCLQEPLCNVQPTPPRLSKKWGELVSLASWISCSWFSMLFSEMKDLFYTCFLRTNLPHYKEVYIASLVSIIILISTRHPLVWKTKV